MELFDSLDLVAVYKLLSPEFKFFVPAYQRGYRWSSDQVEQLIDDLMEFGKYHYQKDKDKFYCLQPLVVKKRNGEDNSLEVIDGQQRLTTILLVLQALHLVDFEERGYGDGASVNVAPKLFSIKYETRAHSNEWLKKVNLVVCDKSKYIEFENHNCDYSHFAEVFVAAYNRLKDLDQDERNNFGEILRKGTKFIWYYPTLSSGSNADIFDRLNAGKIHLNNAELIKALLLQKSNWQSSDIAKARSLALEWNEIENTLQGKEFWGFIYSSQHPFSYDTHIEYIFDLLQGKVESLHEKHFYTFNRYLNSYRLMMGTGGKDINGREKWVLEQWLKVKNLFDTLKEWYQEKSIYHRIGFILEYVTGETVLTLKNKLEGKKHTERIAFLDEIIKGEVSKIQSNRLFYGKKELSEILFLYNIMLEDKRIADNARFSFADYKGVRKNKGWDQEHVASHIDYSPDIKKAEALSKDILELLTGSTPTKDADEIYFIAPDIIKNIEKEELSICYKAIDILNAQINLTTSDKKNTAELSDISPKETNDIESFYNQVTNHFKSDDDEFKIIQVNNRDIDEKDFIWNFVLLNAGTNRSYGNNIYPVKRRRILQDEFQVYTPVGTRNVFEKAYSRKIKQMLFWSKSDAIAYWENICSTLEPYINLTLPF